MRVAELSLDPDNRDAGMERAQRWGERVGQLEVSLEDPEIQREGPSEAV